MVLLEVRVIARISTIIIQYLSFFNIRGSHFLVFDFGLGVNVFLFSVFQISLKDTFIYI